MRTYSKSTVRVLSLVGAFSLAVGCSSKSSDDDDSTAGDEDDSSAGGTGGKGGTGGTAGSGGSAGKGGTGGTAGSGGSGGTGGNTSPDAAAPADAAADKAATDSSPDSAPLVTEATKCDFAKLGTAIAPAAGREIYCAMDIGSNNAKLVVMSMEKGKFDTLKDERSCKNKLSLGTKTFVDGVGKALGQSDIDKLVLVMKQFAVICTEDKGTMVGAEATQWARDATNATDVKQAIMDGVKIPLEILTSTQEGLYGYSAATYGKKGKIFLDPGSNSFQIGWQQDSDALPKTISIPFGYVRSAKDIFAADTTTTYADGRSKFDTKAKADIAAALTTAHATTLAAIKKLVTDGKLAKEIHVPGQDGAVHLSVRGMLKVNDAWVADQAGYDTIVGMTKPVANTLPGGFGQMVTILKATEFDAYFNDVVKAPDFAVLRKDPIRPIYGEKAMGNPVLLDLVARELGATGFLMVPQELPMGYIIAKNSAK